MAPRLSCRAADVLEKGNESILVMPFMDFTQSSPDSDKVTDLFARELVGNGGFRVYHPRVVRKYLNSRKDKCAYPGSLAEAIETAKIFNARYVICGIITEYDGFPPFSLDMSVEMFDVASKERVGADSISRVGASMWQRFAWITQEQTMDRYVRAVCAQLISRSFKRKKYLVNKF